MFNRLRYLNFNKRLLIYLLGLCIISYFAIGSASLSHQKTQLFGMIGGFIIMLVISQFDYNYALKFFRIYYIAAVMLLAIVLISGHTAGGATRWISIAGFRFQPSEICKLLLILFFAVYFARHADQINQPKTILFGLVLIAVPAVLIYREPNLSTTIILLVIFASLLFIAGLSYKIVAGILAVGIPSFVVILILIVRQIIPLRTYQYNRIMSWLDPIQYSTDAYQQQYSIRAIASGQLWGKGINTDSIMSVKNGNFISEPHTDFIFSVVGEEMGFIGCLCVIILFGLIIFELIMTARLSINQEGKLICCGTAIWIGFQAYVNIGVTSGIFPNTGVTLPFISYGLTSLLSLFLAIGIVLNISAQSRIYTSGEINL